MLVVGAGPAGLAAALAARAAESRSCSATSPRNSTRQLLADGAAHIDGSDSERNGWERSLAVLRASPRVTLLPRTTAFGYFPHNLLGLSERITDHLANPPSHLPRER